MNSMVERVKIIYKKGAVLITLLGVCVVLALIFFAINPLFFSSSNFSTLARWFSVLAIVAVGQSFVLISGGIDLSVGSITSFTCMLVSFFLVNLSMPVWIAVPLVLLVACGIGLYHGSFVSLFSPPFPHIVPAFIVTLSSMIAFGGFSLVLTGGWPITITVPSFSYLGESFYAIPVSFVVMLFLFLFSYYTLNKTVLGRYVYAVGGNLEAARLSGIGINKVRATCYMMSSIFAAVAGIIYASMLMAGYPTVGDGEELESIAAAVIGGVSLAGGLGNIIGAVLGAFLMSEIRNGLVLLNVSPYWHDIVVGIVIVVAVGVDLYRSKKG